MQSYSIPIRFTSEEKFILEELALEQNLPLSTFIKAQLRMSLSKQMKNINKSGVLLSKIKQTTVNTEEIDLADKEGNKFKKNLKLTQE